MNCDFTYGRPCSSFALRDFRAKQGLPFEAWPSRRAACHQSGNSMHVAVSGLAILFCLSQVMFDENMLQLQRFQLKRSHALSQPYDVSQSNSKKAKL